MTLCDRVEFVLSFWHAWRQPDCQEPSQKRCWTNIGLCSISVVGSTSLSLSSTSQQKACPDFLAAIHQFACIWSTLMLVCSVLSACSRSLRRVNETAVFSLLAVQLALQSVLGKLSVWLLCLQDGCCGHNKFLNRQARFQRVRHRYK